MLHVAVQHHPSRAHLLPELLDRLPAGAVVVTDPEHDSTVRNPWRCYRACIESTPADASHVLIVQDDAVPHPDLPVVIEDVIAAKPTRIVCLFVASQPARGALAITRAMQAGQPWADLSPTDFLPVVATVWPAELAREFLRWADRNARAGQRSDDGIAGRWIRMKTIRPAATVPCLVDHPDVEQSLIGKRAMAGRNPARVAIVSPEGRDIRSIRWA